MNTPGVRAASTGAWVSFAVGLTRLEAAATPAPASTAATARPASAMRARLRTERGEPGGGAGAGHRVDLHRVRAGVEDRLRHHEREPGLAQERVGPPDGPDAAVDRQGEVAPGREPVDLPAHVRGRPRGGRGPGLELL